MIAPTIASGAAMRNAEKRYGSDAGACSFQRMRQRLAAYERMSSSARGSAERRPRSVLIVTGKNVRYDAITATASVVGAIIGELPSGLQDGLGGAIINFNQYYSFEPQELWATNIIAALLGILFFLTIVLVEKGVVRRAPENVA